MRLLIANQQARSMGGVESYLRFLLPALAPRVGALALLTRETGDPGPDGVPTTGVEWLPVSGESPGELSAAAAAWKPDVVYSHGFGPPEYEAALVAGFPTAVFMHNHGGLCVSGTKCHTFPAPQPCTRTLGLGCLALWYPRRCGGLNPLVAVRRYRTEVRRLQTFKDARTVVVASRYMAGEMIRNGVPAERVKLLPLFPAGASPDPSPPNPRAPTGRILYVGRIVATKGWSHLLAALPGASERLGRPLTLVVAGDGPDRQKFESESRRRGVPAEFLGWIDTPRREAEMRTADLLVVPSLAPEGFGLVGIEAGCVGLPAVAYEVGGIPDWLEAGVSGEMAPGERLDPRQLADAIVRALADPVHWQKLRVGAWEVARRFSVEAHLDRLIPILEAAASTKS